MENADKLRQQIQGIKKALAEERETIENIEALLGEKIQGELWGLSEVALEKAMWDSFFFLERNKECLEEERVASHRKYIGWAIVLSKKILRALMRPYAKMILGRQSRFNRELIQLQLANLLRLEMMKKRIDVLEVEIRRAIKDEQD